MLRFVDLGQALRTLQHLPMLYSIPLTAHLQMSAASTSTRTIHFGHVLVARIESVDVADLEITAAALVEALFPYRAITESIGFDDTDGSKRLATAEKRNGRWP